MANEKEAFTDEDMKQLKFQSQTEMVGWLHSGQIAIKADAIKALIARLEAAEECAQGLAAYVEHEHRYWSDPEPRCTGHDSIGECDLTTGLKRQFKKSIFNWNKAKGEI